MIELIPYRSVNEILLGDSIDRVKEVFGRPVVESKNRSGELVVQYKYLILTFHKETHLLRECAVPYDVPTRINGVDLDWSIPGLMSLCRQDGSPLGGHGSVILFNLGIAMSGVEEGAESDRAVGIFSKDVWDDFRSRLKPFSFD